LIRCLDQCCLFNMRWVDDQVHDNVRDVRAHSNSGMFKVNLNEIVASDHSWVGCRGHSFLQQDFFFVVFFLVLCSVFLNFLFRSLRDVVQWEWQDHFLLLECFHSGEVLGWQDAVVLERLSSVVGPDDLDDSNLNLSEVFFTAGVVNQSLDVNEFMRLVGFLFEGESCSWEAFFWGESTFDVVFSIDHFLGLLRVVALSD